MSAHAVTPSTEDRLLAAASAVVAERGWDGAGVAEIARRAGLTTGAIYSRYSGKAELLVEALDRQMADHLEAVISAGEVDGPTEMLAALGAHILDAECHEVSSNALLVEATVAARREPELAAMLERRLADERMRVAKIIEEAKSRGLFDEALDTTAVVTFIQSIGLGFVFFRMLGTPMPDPDAWQVVIDRVIAAAMPQTSEPPSSTAPTQEHPTP